MINVDGINEIVKSSPDYKVVIKGGTVYVVPVDALGKITFDNNLAGLVNNSVLVVTASGRVIGSRWTNPTMNDRPACDCDDDDYR